MFMASVQNQDIPSTIVLSFDQGAPALSDHLPPGRSRSFWYSISIFASIFSQSISTWQINEDKYLYD